jgi:hypothetical protein
VFRIIVSRTYVGEQFYRWGICLYGAKHHGRLTRVVVAIPKLHNIVTSLRYVTICFTIIF